jgi:uncharacterized protein
MEDNPENNLPPEEDAEQKFELQVDQAMQRAVEEEIASEVEQEMEFELSFPCEYPIKVMGKNEDDFFGFVVDVICRHAPGLTADMFTQHQSSGGKYLSVSIKIIAESRVQVDGLYAELGQHKRVLFAL